MNIFFQKIIGSRKNAEFVYKFSQYPEDPVLFCILCFYRDHQRDRLMKSCFGKK